MGISGLGLADQHLSGGQICAELQAGTDIGPDIVLMRRKCSGFRRRPALFSLK